MSLSGITEEEETFFSTVKKDKFTRTGGYNTRLSLDYTMSLDAKKVSRSVYTFWTVIGDVGGLNGVLISVASTLLSVFSYQKSVNHLVSNLFWSSDPETSDAN